MWIFDALAVIGAITGSTSSIATIVAVRRDRPSLVVNWGYREDGRNVRHLWFTVLNDGRQPVTIREAGFYASELPIRIQRPETGQTFTGTAKWDYKVIREPKFLDPGVQVQEFSPVPDSVENGYHVDFPLRAYVRDAGGRISWGESSPVVRMMWGPRDRPQVIRPAQWDPAEPPLAPARVEPWWKLWVRRELRRGDPGRPSFEELKARTGHADAAETEASG